ncbi:MAG: endonuclease [Paludibacteraceae bacterium]|nr:endonuclease [Paludibacteraceae bacterium]
MKRTLLFIFCSFFALAMAAKDVTPAASLPAYYEKIDGKSGKALFDAVQTVTKTGYSSLGYDGLWSAYKYTDLHENGYVWDMYSDCTWKSINSNHCGNYDAECDCYNREHSIPKSWYGGTTSGPGCDIFHLVPTDGKVNGVRSNYPFGEVSSADYNKHGNKRGSAKNITITGGNTIAGNTGASISASGTVFEPRDEYKGDFARGYMGALLKWAGEKAFTDGEGSKTFTSNYSTGSFGLTKYGVALLMKWHRQDPVSQMEIDRNNGIQQTQGNRNPFIDYPYLAEFIWGEKAGQTLDLDDLITAYDSRFVLGESNGYLKGSSTVDPETKCTITWLVNGEVYTAGNPTTTVNKGGVVPILPTAPKSCDEISSQFVGWSEYEISGSTDNIPTDLFSNADDAPDITQNTIFHAVFAQLEEEETTVSTPATIAMNLNDTQGWTLSGLIKDSKHWRMVTGAYIESPSLDASKITSVTINMRTYGGATYKTIEFSMAGKKIGELSASNKTLNDYTWKPTTSLTGVGALRFSSNTNTTEFGPALSSITIETTGGGTGTTTTYSYSRYITSCQGTSDIDSVEVPTQVCNKIISNGQLLIEYNGVYYNTLGQPMKP